ncbi:MAG TPA: CHAD domain-containing protein [Planctomycetota bacterium]|nr:CHAD domain-containing protein [Planctomycetota bacterium]
MTAVRTDETEIKLRATGPLDVIELDAVVRATGLRCDRAAATEHHDLYLDDQDRTLAHAGVGLRLRHSGDRTVVGCKTAGEPHGIVLVREELEAEWPGREPPQVAADLPPLLRDAIEPLVLARPLRPVLGLQVRREHALLRLADRTLGALVFDQVTAASDGRRADFVEVEIEVQDDIEACCALAKTIARRLPLDPVGDSKLAHGLALFDLAPPEVAEPDAGASLHTVATARLLLHLRAMCRHEVGVRQDRSPEPLHCMRVENRRLRALLRAFRSHWPDDAARELLIELEATGRELGNLRDLDVMLLGVDGMAPRLPKGMQALLPQFQQWLAARRLAVRAELFAFLRVPARIAGLQRLSDAFAQPAPPTATAVAHLAVAGRLAKTGRLLRRLVRALPPELPIESLHELRLASKRLRYLAEEFAAWFGSDFRWTLRPLLRLQQALGEVCDHANAAQRCSASVQPFAAASTDPLAAAALLGALAALHHDASRRACKAAARRIARIDRKKFWRALAAAK